MSATIQATHHPIAVLTRPTKCGTWSTYHKIAVYPDRLIIRSPYVRQNAYNFGNLHFELTTYKDAITLEAVKRALDGKHPYADRYGDTYEDANDYIFSVVFEPERS